MANTTTMCDKEMVSVFLQYVAPYPLGVCVELSDGRTAIVIKNHREMLCRPTVKASDGSIIKLMDELDVTITKLLTSL